MTAVPPEEDALPWPDDSTLNINISQNKCKKRKRIDEIQYSLAPIHNGGSAAGDAADQGTVYRAEENGHGESSKKKEKKSARKSDADFVSVVDSNLTELGREFDSPSKTRKKKKSVLQGTSMLSNRLLPTSQENSWNVEKTLSPSKKANKPKASDLHSLTQEIELPPRESSALPGSPSKKKKRKKSLSQQSFFAKNCQDTIAEESSMVVIGSPSKKAMKLKPQEISSISIESQTLEKLPHPVDPGHLDSPTKRKKKKRRSNAFGNTHSKPQESQVTVSTTDHFPRGESSQHTGSPTKKKSLSQESYFKNHLPDISLHESSLIEKSTGSLSKKAKKSKCPENSSLLINSQTFESPLLTPTKKKKKKNRSSEALDNTLSKLIKNKVIDQDTDCSASIVEVPFSQSKKSVREQNQSLDGENSSKARMINTLPDSEGSAVDTTISQQDKDGTQADYELGLSVEEMCYRTCLEEDDRDDPDSAAANTQEKQDDFDFLGILYRNQVLDEEEIPEFHNSAPRGKLMTKDEIQEKVQYFIMLESNVHKEHTIEPKVLLHLKKHHREALEPYNMKFGKLWTRPEDDVLLANWEKFKSKYGFEEIDWQCFEINKVTPQMTLLGFYRFMGHGLQKRTLQSIHRRFIHIMKFGLRKHYTTYSPEEDDYIRMFLSMYKGPDVYARLAKMLNRDRLSLRRHCENVLKKVVSDEFPDNVRNMKLPKEALTNFIKVAMDVSNKKTVHALLQKKHIRYTKISRLLGIPSAKVYRTWNYYLRFALQLESKVLKSQVMLDMLDAVQGQNCRAIYDVDWEAVSKLVVPFHKLQLRKLFMDQYNKIESRCENLQLRLEALRKAAKKSTKRCEQSYNSYFHPLPHTEEGVIL